MLVPCHAALAQEDAPRVPGSLLRTLVDDPDAPVLGNPSGTHVVVEFFDYRCPYCRRFQAELRPFLKEDGEARVILKEWPVFGGISIYAARVALAARWQGRFAAVHEALFAHRGPLDEPGVRQVAARAGVDLARLDRDLAQRADELDRMLAKVQAEADALHLRGTPGLVIGGYVIGGAVSFEDLENLVGAGG